MLIVVVQSATLVTELPFPGRQAPRYFDFFAGLAFLADFFAFFATAMLLLPDVRVDPLRQDVPDLVREGPVLLLGNFGDECLLILREDDRGRQGLAGGSGQRLGLLVDPVAFWGMSLGARRPGLGNPRPGWGFNREQD